MILDDPGKGRLVASRGKEQPRSAPISSFRVISGSFFMNLRSRPYKVTTTAQGPAHCVGGSIPDGFQDKNYRFEMFSHRSSMTSAEDWPCMA